MKQDMLEKLIKVCKHTYPDEIETLREVSVLHAWLQALEYKLVVSLQMQNRKTTDKINEISIVPNGSLQLLDWNGGMEWWNGIVL